MVNSGIPMTAATRRAPPSLGDDMIALGLVLLLIGLFVAGAKVLFTIGLILLIVGLVLNFVPMGGSRRRVW